MGTAYYELGSMKVWHIVAAGNVQSREHCLKGWPAPMDDVRVRRALAMTIVRETLAQAGYPNLLSQMN